MDAEFFIIDDCITRVIPEDRERNIYRYEPVMDKETFIKAYNTWIKGTEVDDGK